MLIQNKLLAGQVNIPPSKSVSHRAIICAALASGTSTIHNLILSEDTLATISCLRLLGARIEYTLEQGDRYQVIVQGGLSTGLSLTEPLDCGESGSTIRFVIPIAAALGANCTFSGRGRLVERPLNSYYEIFEQQCIAYQTNNGCLPLSIQGRLQAGEFVMRGDISSQFITGLLFALPLMQADSKIVLTTKLESVGYIDLTLQALAEFGIKIENKDYREFVIKGGQSYQARDYVVEGDYSQAAFWLVAACLGNKIVCHGLNPHSLQADKAILNIIEDMGGEIVWLSENSVTCTAKTTKGCTIDVSNCPDIAPILTVLAALSTGRTEIVNGARLRIKESDRIASITAELSKLGAKVSELPEGLLIEGVAELGGNAELDAWNDHRIAMSMAVACTRSTAANKLTGYSSVKKSYPGFWADYRAVGGVCEE